MIIMDLKEIQKEIPECIEGKDCFGAVIYYIPTNILTKRKAWNLLIKRGFTICPNKLYLKKDKIVAWNNKLIQFLNIGYVK